MKNYNKALKTNSRNLRTRMTDAERLLWSKIRRQQILGLTFNRQKPIGEYIVDFYCAKHNLVVELDGSQHFEDTNKQSDLERDAFLRDNDLTVLRFSNKDVFENIEGVLAEILKNVQ